jgi:hypothetical protein
MRATTVHICSGLMLQRVRPREQAHFSPPPQREHLPLRVSSIMLDRSAESWSFFSCCPLFGVRERGTAQAFPGQRRLKPQDLITH